MAPAAEQPVNIKGEISGPALSVDRNEIFLGSLGLFPSEHTTRFELSNVGSESLEIHEIEVSCGCLEAHPGRNVIEPGESTLLDVTVSVDEAGDKTTQIVLHTNDPAQPRVLLLVSWTGIASIEAIPSRIDFGGIRPGESVTQRFDIRLHDESLKLSDYSLDTSEELIVRETPSKEGMVAAYEVTVVGEETEGCRNGRIRLSRGPRDDAALLVIVAWEVVDVVTVTPSRIFLGSGDTGREFRSQIVILSNVDKPAEISSAVVADSGHDIEVSYPEEPAKLLMIDIVGTLPVTEGAFTTDLIVTLMQPEPRTITIPVTALVAHRQPEEAEEAGDEIAQ